MRYRVFIPRWDRANCINPTITHYEEQKMPVCKDCGACDIETSGPDHQPYYCKNCNGSNIYFEKGNEPLDPLAPYEPETLANNTPQQEHTMVQGEPENEPRVADVSGDIQRLARFGSTAERTPEQQIADLITHLTGEADTARDACRILDTVVNVDPQAPYGYLARLGLRQVALVLRKGNDYGGSIFKAPVLTPGMDAGSAILVRLSDKLARLERLIDRKHQAQVDEPIAETMADVIGYCLLYITHIRNDIA